MVQPVYLAEGGTSGAVGVSNNSTGNIFLDVLDRVANWDAMRRYGLPVSIDGGSGTGATRPALQNAERTPPAALGQHTGFSMPPISNNTLLIGGAVVLGVVGLVLALK